MLEFALKLTQGGFTLDAALRLDAGVTGLFGPSGSGKSTLLAVLAGLQRPAEGRITLAGETLFDTATGVNWPPHRRRIGVVFQDGRLLPHLGVTANLRFGLPARATGGPSFDHVVEVLALSGLLSRRVQALSGGERQRVALGRALLAAPQLLLLDEPLAALDEGMKQQILPFLRRVKEDFKLPMIYVAHAINEILHLTSTLAVMDAGRIIGYGRFSEIIHEQRVLALAHALGLQNVLSLTVVSSDVALGSTSARHGAQTFLLPLARLAPGATAQVAVRAENIALALCPAAHTTIQNQLPGVITRITPLANRLLVEVDAGLPLIAEVSARAVNDLALVKGTPVYCLIKANAFAFLGQDSSLEVPTQTGNTTGHSPAPKRPGLA